MPILSPLARRCRFQHIFELSHDLDLIRCYGNDKMPKKLEALARDLDEAPHDWKWDPTSPSAAPQAMCLARFAEDLVLKSGDRVLYSPSNRGSRQSRDPDLFPRASKPPACFELFGIDAAPSTTQPPPPELPPAAPPVPGEGAEPTRVRFIGSMYKKLHAAQMAKWRAINWDNPSNIDDQKQDVLDAAEALINEYCTVHGISSRERDKFRRKLFAGKDVDPARPLDDEAKIEALAERLWVSPERLNSTREFCTIVNEAIRVDCGTPNDHESHNSIEAQPVSPMLKPAVTIVCMMQLHLTAARRPDLVHADWPKGEEAPHGKGRSTFPDTTIRGGGLPAGHLPFFEAMLTNGGWYRVPHPLASSFSNDQADKFIRMQNGRDDPTRPGKIMPKVKWIIKLKDPDVSPLDQRRTVNANFLKHNNLGEEEFLFSAYSAFRVLKIEPSSNPLWSDAPTKITILACVDNKEVPEDVPTAPWH